MRDSEKSGGGTCNFSVKLSPHRWRCASLFASEVCHFIYASGGVLVLRVESVISSFYLCFTHQLQIFTFGMSYN